MKVKRAHFLAKFIGLTYTKVNMFYIIGKILPVLWRCVNWQSDYVEKYTEIINKNPPLCTEILY